MGFVLIFIFIIKFINNCKLYFQFSWGGLSIIINILNQNFYFHELLSKKNVRKIINSGAKAFYSVNFLENTVNARHNKLGLTISFANKSA